MRWQGAASFGGLFILLYFFLIGFSFFFDSLFCCSCFSAFLLLCFFGFPLFDFSLLLCFSAVLLLLLFQLLCFFAFLLFRFSAFLLFLLLCLSTSTFLFLQSCVFAPLLLLLPFFTVSCFFFPLLLLYSLCSPFCIPNESLETPK